MRFQTQISNSKCKNHEKKPQIRSVKSKSQSNLRKSPRGIEKSTIKTDFQAGGYSILRSKLRLRVLKNRRCSKHNQKFFQYMSYPNYSHRPTLNILALNGLALFLLVLILLVNLFVLAWYVVNVEVDV